MNRELEGKMFLRLFHGRKDPAEDMQDWGLDGPIFGPLQYVHTTYANDLKIADADGHESVLRLHDDMVYYDGVYYGDWSVFVLLMNQWNTDTLIASLKKFEAAKAELPKPVAIVHGLQIKKGHCHDCGQGSLGASDEGFEFFQEDAETKGHWFCRFCGSNHVDVVMPDGTEVEQGSLY